MLFPPRILGLQKPLPHIPVVFAPAFTEKLLAGAGLFRLYVVKDGEGFPKRIFVESQI